MNQSVSDPAEIQTLIQGITEVEELFGKNIVQGKLNEKGNYHVDLKKGGILDGKEEETISHLDERIAGTGKVVVEKTCGDKEKYKDKPIIET